MVCRIQSVIDVVLCAHSVQVKSRNAGHDSRRACSFQLLIWSEQASLGCSLQYTYTACSNPCLLLLLLGSMFEFCHQNFLVLESFELVPTVKAYFYLRKLRKLSMLSSRRLRTNFSFSSNYQFSSNYRFSTSIHLY